MLRLQEITRGSRVLGIVPGQAVLVLDTRSFGGAMPWRSPTAPTPA